MRLVNTLLCASFGLALSACAPGGAVNQGEEEAAEDADPRALTGDATWIVTRQDFRKCMSPMCGGVFVKQVNKAKSTCLDGSKQPDCYVGELDLESTGLPEEQAIELKGRALSGQVLFSGELVELQGGIAKLQVNKAHEAITEGAATGTYYLLQSSGIQCVKAPCESLEARKLNSSTVKPLTTVDLSALALSAEDEQAALSQIMESSILAAGTISSKKVNGGTERKLTVTQLFETVEAEASQQLCLADDECGADAFCDMSVCLSNCPPDMICPAVCYGACTPGEAPPPPPAGDSCAASCGEASPDASCYCDAACEYYGDCCSDYASACL